MSGIHAEPLPSGVVSLLFTDVEGSTRLWAADSDAMSSSLRLHDAILRAAVESRGGYVFATAGDSFAVAFSHASAAVDAAAAAQAELSQAAWPGPTLRVRMGLHLGEAEERGGDYFGPVVNACARVEAAGHGGQVLLTESIASVIDHDALVDLGEHHLRDLPTPIHLYQVGAGEFPPLRGIVGARDTLPQRRTRLLGRDREIAVLRALLADERLVTLVGPGGIGKTSLSIEAAGGLGATFPGGLHFADLAQVNEPDGIVAALCRGIGLATTNAPYEQFCAHLAERTALLIVDNCEHLIDDVAELVDQLLNDLPSLTLLATSREHLDIDGERVVTVGPLAGGVDSAAVRLFVERVVAAAPEFSPSTDDLETIANICERLDGMPLAIELAAGRTRAMSLADIERGLSDRFTLLAGTRRGKLRRQQTLRAAIDWSIDLLTHDERRALARLAVITGPFAMTVASAVVETSTAASADLIASLTAKSLVQRAADFNGEARFSLLETVREWGLDELNQRGELRNVRDAHAQWYFTQADSFGTIEYSTVTCYSAMTGPIVDPVAAAEHLRDADVTAAAHIIARYGRGIVEAGLAATARAIQREARAAGGQLLPCRLWIGEHALIMDLAEGFPFADPPPPDDGTFDWRFCVGGPEYENAGLLGWYRAWTQPQAVIDEFEALPPVAADIEAIAIRAFATSNVVHAYGHLGHWHRVLETFEDSAALWQQTGTPRAGVATEATMVTTAAVVTGADLRGSVQAREIEALAGSNQYALVSLSEAVVLSDPSDRHRAIAQTARTYCDGRYPDDESAVLPVLAFYALEHDPAQAASLIETAAMRSPGGAALQRYVRLVATGQPLELMADQAHHQAAMAAHLDPTLFASQLARRQANRRKLEAELARILD